MAPKFHAFAKASAKANALRAALLLAQSETPIAAMADAFDFDPWLLNVLNGTIDLRTGELRPHQRDDMITMLAPEEIVARDHLRHPNARQHAD